MIGSWTQDFHAFFDVHGVFHPFLTGVFFSEGGKLLNL